MVSKKKPAHEKKRGLIKQSLDYWNEISQIFGGPKFKYDKKRDFAREENQTVWLTKSLAEPHKESIDYQGPRLPLWRQSPDLRQSPEHLREEQNRTLLRQAEGGDTSSAREILERFCDGVNVGKDRGRLVINSFEISPAILQYLSECFEKLKDEPDANKVLNLTTTTKGRKRQREDVERDNDICISVLDKIEEGKPKQEAYIEVAEEKGLKWRRVESIYQQISRNWPTE